MKKRGEVTGAKIRYTVEMSTSDKSKEERKQRKLESGIGKGEGEK